MNEWELRPADEEIELWRCADKDDWRFAGHFPSVVAAQLYVSETIKIEQQIELLRLSTPPSTAP